MPSRYVHRNFFRDEQLSKELRAAEMMEGPRLTSVRDRQSAKASIPTIFSAGRCGMFVSEKQLLKACFSIVSSDKRVPFVIVFR